VYLYSRGSCGVHYFRRKINKYDKSNTFPTILFNISSAQNGAPGGGGSAEMAQRTRLLTRGKNLPRHSAFLQNFPRVMHNHFRAFFLETGMNRLPRVMLNHFRAFFS
jgi:hypothetical protein